MASDPPPPPRLCQIAKVDNFDGFGFNLHAEKNKPGQFIGKIDVGSPAEVAGLKEGDRQAECHLIILCLLRNRSQFPKFDEKQKYLKPQDSRASRVHLAGCD